MTQLGRGREFDLIRAFVQRARTEHPDVALGPGDDCAILPPYAISTDLSVEHVHFRRDWLEPQEIGYRAAAAALSDLAAVAATPVAALISFAFSLADAEAWAGAVVQGATDAIEQFGAVLAGGDVARSDGAAIIDVVVIGKVEQPILRSSAQVGDVVCVTGTLGGSAAAIADLSAGKTPDPRSRDRFARPHPRVREALWLRERVALHALLDLSDGIAGDAGHIAAASKCQLVIDAALLPLATGASRQQGLGGGEDYELCFTASEEEVAGVQRPFASEFGIPLTIVGKVDRGDGVVIRHAEASGGFDHFAKPGG